MVSVFLFGKRMLLSGMRASTEGVEHDCEAALLVVEGVKDETDEVVGVDGVPLAHGGLDLARLGIEAAKSEIDVVRVVREVRQGLLAWVFVDVGLESLPILELEGRGPDRVVEHAVENGRGGGRDEGLEGEGLARGA
jgi:hypothetical protein